MQACLGVLGAVTGVSALVMQFIKSFVFSLTFINRFAELKKLQNNDPSLQCLVCPADPNNPSLDHLPI